MNEKHAQRLEPGSPLALHLLGILHAYERCYELAEEAFLRAVKAEPEMAGSYVELGLVYACRGKYREMVEALGRAFKSGASAVRAYLGERPLGDITVSPSPNTQGRTSADAEGESVGVYALLASAVAYLVTRRRQRCWREP